MQSHDNVHALLHGIVGDVTQVTLLVAVVELRSGDLVPSSIGWGEKVLRSGLKQVMTRIWGPYALVGILSVLMPYDFIKSMSDLVMNEA